MEALRLEGISVRFGGVRAVSDLSFSVMVGERLAIIGPNGAGKTTLFNVLNGQLPPTTGKLFLFEKDISRRTPDRRAHLGMGRSFQISRLFFDLKVIENAFLALQGVRPSRFGMIRPVGSDGSLIEEARALLEPIGLWDRKDTFVKNIAYGEQKRLEIALSLASQPRVLLLDEPNAGLTATESKEISQLISDFAKDITVILIAHDMEMVFDFAERIIVLHYGEIICDGPPNVVSEDSRVKEVYMGS
jgi:branched-chain amino acid transport system ATP-binding protein